ncbi:MAG: hypothetical protein LBS15_02880 [Endomicrobium sp.]|jgi:hypothetical protein|nr:hypothetical protein [Endomicrobium sp.]
MSLNKSNRDEAKSCICLKFLDQKLLISISQQDSLIVEVAYPVGLAGLVYGIESRVGASLDGDEDVACGIKGMCVGRGGCRFWSRVKCHQSR